MLELSLGNATLFWRMVKEKLGEAKESRKNHQILREVLRRATDDKKKEQENSLKE